MVLALVVHGVEARESSPRRPSATGMLIFLTLFFVLGGLDPNFQLIITKPDNVPIVGLIFLLVFFTWYSMREAVLNDQRIAKGEGPIEKAEVGSRLGVARPGLHRADLADPVHGGADRLVDSAEGAARAAGKPRRDAEPVEGAVVLPGSAGNARLLRSLAGRRRAAEPDHRRPDRDSLHRQEPEGQRLLHVQRAQGRDHDVPVRLPHPLVVAHRARHVPARTELELLRAVRVLGHRTSSRR